MTFHCFLGGIVQIPSTVRAMWRLRDEGEGEVGFDEGWKMLLLEDWLRVLLSERNTEKILLSSWTPGIYLEFCYLARLLYSKIWSLLTSFKQLWSLLEPSLLLYYHLLTSIFALNQRQLACFWLTSPTCLTKIKVRQPSGILNDSPTHIFSFTQSSNNHSPPSPSSLGRNTLKNRSGNKNQQQENASPSSRIVCSSICMYLSCDWNISV
jgi:hypothetical protein